jgi:threonine aldolase
MARLDDGRMNGSEVIDLRSDTVTRPSAAMMEAIARAEVGDDVYGEDPTINALEERTAGLLGKEAGLFVPSGSQANLVALLTHEVRGEEVVLGQDSHTMRFEAGGAAAVAGAQFSVVPGHGLFTADQVRSRIETRTLHNPGTRLVWVENTHNMGGGRVFALEEMKRIRQVCDEHRLGLHMDGARLFNAAVATSRPARHYADVVDTTSICLSKGLGAPCGSVLVGPRAFIDGARRNRKMLGGAMRQAGLLAAAGLHALEHNVERLAEDHANARLLAEGLSAIDSMSVDLPSVETNIVMADCSDVTAGRLAELCRARGVLFHPMGEHRIRLVTHLDVSREQVLAAVERIGEALRA